MTTEQSPVEPVPESSLSCHKDQTRICGPDCMAYLATPPTGVRYTGQQWARCLELVSQEKLAYHLTILTNDVSKHLVVKERSAPAPGAR